jgi:hypothetical protein
MYFIAIVGALEGENELAMQMFYTFCQKKQSVIYLCNDHVIKLNQSKQFPECFLITQCEKIELLKNIIPDIIVIKKADSWDLWGIREASDSWIIVDSQDFEGIELAARLRGKAISCGLKQNSTLLISGLEGENLTFSLQRKLTNIWGKEVEEQDIVVPKENNLDEFDQAALLATRLICGLKS